MRFVRHIDGRRFHMRGAQVNQGVLEDAAEILNVPLHKNMTTPQIVDAIVNDSYGRPDTQEKAGLDFIIKLIRRSLGPPTTDSLAFKTMDVESAIAWLERGGKRR